MAFRVRLVVLWFFVISASVVAQQNEPVDLVALVLIPGDLEDAVKSMTMYDLNDDGVIDKDEQNRVPWRDSIPAYDLNRDGKLTHLETALRFAKLRGDRDIIQIDINIASKYLRRHDANGNGQLDANEVALGWPPDPEEFDENSDGILTQHEIATTFAFRRGLRMELGIMGVDQGGAIKLVNQFDTNSNGKLEGDELAAAPLPRPAADFDHDKDGKLTVMEVATMLARHRMDSGLSKADQLQARNFLLRLDMDRDGKIGSEEMDAATASLGVRQADLLALDSNKDGQITLAEVETRYARERKKKGYMDEHAAAAQRFMLRHDSNRDGYIEKSELEPKAGKGQLSVELLVRIDFDKDQRISFDELAKYVATQEQP